MQRDDLYNRLLFLVPNAKFVFWPIVDDSNKGYDNVVIIDDWRVVWYPENIEPMPTLQQIQDIDSQSLDDYLETKRKTERDSQMKKDISVVASYKLSLSINPLLTFTQYLDELELAMSNL